MKELFLRALFLAVGVFPLFSQQGAALPVKTAVLFTNGVGYFSREAVVSGSGSLELYFNTKDINDLLKSMIIRDLDGGSITAVNYSPREPLGKALGGFSVDLSVEAPLTGLLRQARGETVEISADKKYTGAILSTEARPVFSGSEDPFRDVSGGSRDISREEVFINIYGDAGLQSIALKTVQSIRFENPRLRQELEEALRLIAAARNTEQRSVSISYEGSGQRRVQAAYIAETPVWKTTYRLVAGSGNKAGKHFLQGWSIVENTSGEDWNGIHLELISGMPVSFAMDLYQPLFNPRPFIPYALPDSLASQIYDEGFVPEGPAGVEANSLSRMDSEKELSEAPAFKSRRAAAPAPISMENLASSVSAAASGAAAGEFFRYTIENPVNLPRGKSAMIPLLNEEIEGEKLSIYNESVHARHPMNGLFLKNTSALNLMGGPITVYEDEIYAGDARMENLAPGAQRLISYSLDLSTEIISKSASQPEVISSLRLNRGVLLVTRMLRKEREYNLINRGEGSRTVLIEHPASADWKLVEPSSAVEETGSLYRFRVERGAQRDSRTLVRVVEERVLEQSIGLSNLADHLILFYRNQQSASPAVRSALEKLAAMKNELADITRSWQAAGSQVNAIHQEQERIRANMDSLDRTSSLYQRYAEILSGQENTLASCSQTMDNLKKQETEKRKAIDDFLASLDVK